MFHVKQSYIKSFRSRVTLKNLPISTYHMTDRAFIDAVRTRQEFRLYEAEFVCSVCAFTPYIPANTLFSPSNATNSEVFASQMRNFCYLASFFDHFAREDRVPLFCFINCHGFLLAYRYNALSVIDALSSLRSDITPRLILIPSS